MKLPPLLLPRNVESSVEKQTIRNQARFILPLGKVQVFVPPPGAMFLEFEICTMPSATFGPDSGQPVPLDRGAEAKTMDGWMGSGAEEWFPPSGARVYTVGVFIVLCSGRLSRKCNPVRGRGGPFLKGPYTPYPSRRRLVRPQQNASNVLLRTDV